MTKKEQILSSFLKTKLNIPKGVKYEFVDLDGKRALKVYTDVAKTDKNSGQYDEEYAKFFKPKNKSNKFAMFTYDWSKKFEGVFTEFFNSTGLPKEYYKVFDEFINYDYISDINDKIEEAIKRTNYPNTELSWDRSTNPEITITFTNLTKEQFDDWRSFRDELQNILGSSVDLEEYTTAFRQPRQSR
jgi:hypothetical protein